MHRHILRFANITAATLSLLTSGGSALAVPAEGTDGADQGMAPFLALGLEELMAINVTISTNSPQSLAKAPAVVSVITADDIRATGATNLTEILQSIPGVYIKPNLFGFRPHVTMRGATAAQTLLMVNGAPMKDLAWASGIFWKGLPTSMIERVEIIRGPGSAVFGSDAYAGVINVITKTAGVIDHTEAGMRAGSFDSREGWVQYGGQWNGFDIAFTANVSRTDGHNPLIATDGQTAQDKKTGTHVSYAPAHVGYGWDNQDLRFSIARGNWRLNADYTHHGNVETGLTGAAVLDPLTRGSDTRYNIDLLYNNDTIARDWGLNAELRYLHLDYTSGNGFQEYPPGYKATAAGVPYANGVLNLQRAAERRLSFEASGLYTGVKNHAIRLGGGHVSQDLYSVEQYINKGTGPNGTPIPAPTAAGGSPLVNVSDTPYAFAPEKVRTISYFFLQDIWAIADAWELTAGARYDNYSDFGGTVNPRAALVWRSTDRLTTKLMYGQAFRAPSYLELYSQTAATRPNPDLTPERSNTWDLEFAFSASKDLKLSIDFYRFDQTNVIGADATNKYQNIGALSARGVEMEALWQATKTLRVSGNLNNRWEDYSPLRSFNVPKQKAYLRTDWVFIPGWNWNLQANWIGRHLHPAGDPRSPVAAYSVVDTTLRYSHHRKWELAASIRNLFDVDAREYSSSAIPGNLPLPRRNAYAEIRFGF
jgi:iron complex outermembrane receptor protein